MSVSAVTDGEHIINGGKKFKLKLHKKKLADAKGGKIDLMI